MSNLSIEWRNPESRGWTDKIPTAIFERSEVLGFEHDCVKGSDKLTCRATAFVFERIAIIDYARDHREPNEEAGLFIGQTIVIFRDKARLEVESVLWRDEDNGDVQNLKPTVKMEA